MYTIIYVGISHDSQITSYLDGPRMHAYTWSACTRDNLPQDYDIYLMMMMKMMETKEQEGKSKEQTRRRKSYGTVN